MTDIMVAVLSLTGWPIFSTVHSYLLVPEWSLTPSKAPAIAHDGPKVMLINGYSSSGGDAFPYFFKKMDLENLSEPVRGEVWSEYQEMPGLLNGGYVSVPRFGIFDKDEGWIIEGVVSIPILRWWSGPSNL